MYKVVGAEDCVLVANHSVGASVDEILVAFELVVVSGYFVGVEDFEHLEYVSRYLRLGLGGHADDSREC